MRAIMIAVSALLAFFHLWPASAGYSRPPEFAVTRIAGASNAVAMPAAKLVPKAQFNPITAVSLALGPRGDLIDCKNHFKRALIDCAGNGPCRQAAQDRADLCDAVGYWRED